MHRTCSIPLLLALACCGEASAQANRSPNAQWRRADTTLFDLVQNGYTIVAMTSAPARSPASPEDTYILQKTNSVYRCVETRAAESAATRSTPPLRCTELVKPYSD
ncbi:hypothetical protein [Caballeronia sp. M1242]|uniref:hypothetical protein n=1 Tax=Caballeronia sp. M1242 TaxID=2814653 RepID=UPI0019D17241|nr:hypothetical protein [Caballeronia sp. M1242]QSN61943.1 hypothetical protein JYK05_03305 [Caballeronia sp. M1242]